MSIETDDEGRLYLPSEVRETYGDKFHLIKYDDRFELIPIADDPLAAVRDELGDALAGKSRETLRKDALKRAASAIVEDVETQDPDPNE
jgi:bifunctional DNA-binding transcriptional regulator/antitoxin component of YhaV-PrlF toxin-antitoxin module